MDFALRSTLEDACREVLQDTLATLSTMVHINLDPLSLGNLIGFLLPVSAEVLAHLPKAMKSSENLTVLSLHRFDPEESESDFAVWISVFANTPRLKRLLFFWP